MRSLSLARARMLGDSSDRDPAPQRVLRRSASSPGEFCVAARAPRIALQPA